MQTPASPAGFGAAHFQWEFGTATACHLIGVNAFDQPDVQRAKESTRRLLRKYQARGALPQPQEIWAKPPYRLFGEGHLPVGEGQDSIVEILTAIFRQTGPRSYLAFLPYLKQVSAHEKRFSRVRQSLRDKQGICTTVGFGPRYLHSTGQYHKGGPDGGVFLLLTATPLQDVPQPAADYTFGILALSQALGDLQALSARGRRAYVLQMDSPSDFRSLADYMVAAAEGV
jgi:hypothetical protein